MADSVKGPEHRADEMKDRQSLADKLCDRATRAGACEIAIVAHALVDPAALVACREHWFSPAAGFALEAIAAEWETVGTLSTTGVGQALYSAHGFTRPEHCDAAQDMVDEAARLSVADLAACGRLELLLILLADAQEVGEEGRAWARAA